MPNQIRPNNNARSSGLPVDDEVEAVIVTPYVWDPLSEQYIRQEQGGGGGGGVAELVAIRDGVDGTRKVVVDAAGRLSVVGVPNEVGAWSYMAGASGTFNVVGRVVGISVFSVSGGTLTIAGGASIPIPAGVSINIQPNAQLVSPAVVATGTDSVFIEILT